MEERLLQDLPLWGRLKDAASRFEGQAMHLKHLLADRERGKSLAAAGGGLYYDFSRQRMDTSTLSLLLELAEARGVQRRFQQMVAGEPVNVSEKRAALHTATRDFSGRPIMIAGCDVMGDVRRVRDDLRLFAAQVHGGELTGTTGQPFRHVVVIGIGGSHLGTEFVAEALAAFADRGVQLHYLANVDGQNFGRVAARVEPAATLWVVISKSFTTIETEANTGLALELLRRNGLDPARHLVTVTSQGSPGDDPARPKLRAFHMFDYIGGRYSVTSAVGGVPLSLLLGWERFEAFLRGAEAMDRHAATAPGHRNLPLLAALLSLWNTSLLGYPAQAIIPYAAPLHRLAAHVQQLNMESNGKAVTSGGHPLPPGHSGPIIFGEPGTNAQHSFFQLAHQGRPFPIEFIGVLHPQYGPYPHHCRGVDGHQELWANLIAQPMALALGQESGNPDRRFPGNRPSTTLLLRDLSPESVGRLLSFYEARTVYEAFLWGLNPFDQFGVELGKKLADGVRGEMAARNTDPQHRFDALDPISTASLEILFRGELPVGDEDT